MCGLIHPGDTFRGMPSDQGVMHLCVVLALDETVVGAPTALLVNVTSFRRDEEQTCVLRPSDPEMHPFITHDSLVLYRRIAEEEQTTVLTWERAPSVSAEVLQRMQEGALASKFVRRRLKGSISRAMQRR